MGIFTSNKEIKTQLFFRDDMQFEFVKRPLEFTCLVERAGEALKRAWKHFFMNQLPFAGYKGISADMVTLGYSRDIILDPFNKIPVGEELSEKPSHTGDSLKRWIAKVAENQRHLYRSKRKEHTMVDKVAWALMVILGIMVIGWVVAFTT